MIILQMTTESGKLSLKDLSPGTKLREFKFSKHVRLMKTNFLRNMIFIFQDFEGNKQHAIIAKQRGQTGIFFPLDAVSFQYDAIILNRIPADWIDEQTIIRLMIKFSRIYLYISEN